MAQINKPNTQFNPVLYTGNGGTQSITGVNFQPDFVWYKDRTNASSHGLFDSVRGADKFLSSNLTIAEITQSGVSSFDSDGFSLGSDSGGNGIGNTFVAWNWKAGGTAVSNTDGTITSSVSANTDSGFSIVGWTGTGATATVGHGLGTTPKLFIVRERSEPRNWPVVTTAIDGSWDSLYLNLTDAAGNGLQSADSSVFNFTSSNEYNASGQTYIAYAFADVKGFSKISSYVGNGSTDGTFIYTGFKPSFFLVKSTAAGESWLMFDIDRNTYNGIDGQVLRPDLANAEVSSLATKLEFLSNGFKWRSNDAGHNGLGTTYIYMAFAENPLVGTNNIPATAR